MSTCKREWTTSAGRLPGCTLEGPRSLVFRDGLTKLPTRDTPCLPSQGRKQKKEEAKQEAKAATPVGAVQEAAAAVGSGLEALKASGQAASSGGLAATGGDTGQRCRHALRCCTWAAAASRSDRYLGLRTCYTGTTRPSLRWCREVGLRKQGGRRTLPLHF